MATGDAAASATGKMVLSSFDILNKNGGAILASRLVTARSAAALSAVTAMQSRQGERWCYSSWHSDEIGGPAFGK